MKKIVSVILLISVIATIFCFSAAAYTDGPSSYYSAVSRPTSPEVTAMNGAGAANNSGGNVFIRLFGSSFNFTNAPLASVQDSGYKTITTIYYSNSPYSCTFKTTVISADGSGEVFVRYY